MLVPPRVGETAAYASLRQDSLSRPNSVRGWLNSIGAENRSLLRHLELTFLHTERVISSLDVHYQMLPAEQSVVVENVMWDDGQLGGMEWHVFTALDTESESRVIEEDAQSIGTLLLFETDNLHDGTKELGPDTDKSEDDWETTRTSGESSGRLLAPTGPPQVQLTRKNGEAFSNPRWSFAGKFNDHLLRRLTSLSHDSFEKKLPKPVAVTWMPDLVVASDRAIDDDHEVIEIQSWDLL
ncbi:hypothetical protein MBLNU13_g09399t1 [Cladosporium sp. NU13]